MTAFAPIAATTPSIMRVVQGLARRDAARSPLRTPCLDRWRRRGDWSSFDPLWRAACWEAAALATIDPERRVRCLTFSRLEIATARGDRGARAA